MTMNRSLAVDRFRVHLSSVYDPIPTMKCERKETISVFKNVGVKETMYIQNHIRIQISSIASSLTSTIELSV